MSNLTLRGNASGSGTFIVESPNSNTSRTITLPDATTTLVGTDATQTLTNKTIQGGALTLDTAKTATGTAIDFTGIPSWARRITVTFDGVSTTGTAGLLLQLGDSGGIETSGYLGSSQQGGTAGGPTTSGLLLVPTNAAANLISGVASIQLLNGLTYAMSGLLGFSNTGGICSAAGSKTLSATLDRIRITTTGTDTFDAGSINILYEG